MLPVNFKHMKIDRISEKVKLPSMMSKAKYQKQAKHKKYTNISIINTNGSLNRIQLLLN